jgi:hypothetical protein
MRDKKTNSPSTAGTIRSTTTTKTRPNKLLQVTDQHRPEPEWNFSGLDVYMKEGRERKGESDRERRRETPRK